MEQGNHNEAVEKLLLELEDGPERVLQQSFQLFDSTHREYLDSIILGTEHRENPLMYALLTSIGKRLSSDFKSCINSILTVEPQHDDQVGLTAWFIQNERYNRAPFINLYTHSSGFSIKATDEETTLRLTKRHFMGAHPVDTLYEEFSKSFKVDVTGFYNNFKKHDL